MNRKFDKQRLVEFFCNIKNAFTVTFLKCNGYFWNEILHFF